MHPPKFLLQEKAKNEDQLLLQLSAHLIADPQTQADKDQNAIVNHAIDKLIPMERTASGLFYRIIPHSFFLF